MTPETFNSKNLLGRWVGATTLGWLLGFIALVALAFRRADRSAASSTCEAPWAAVGADHRGRAIDRLQ